MERKSRMAKYQDLRASIQQNSEQAKQSTNTTTVEPKTFEQPKVSTLTTATNLQEDTLIEQLTLENINSQPNEVLDRALSDVRESQNQPDSFNTRVDILNKIRQSKINAGESEEELIPTPVNETIEEEDEPIVEKTTEDEAFSRFGFKRAVEEEEEEVEEEITEEVTTKTGIFHFGKKNVEEEDEEEVVEEEIVEEEDEEEEKPSLLIKILNGIIILLSIALVGLIAYMVKGMF